MDSLSRGSVLGLYLKLSYGYASHTEIMAVAP